MEKMKFAEHMKDNLSKRIQELDLRKNFLRIDRKIEFLLDIRGYFIVNKIKGNYLEFGCYNGEMLFAALKILGPKKLSCKFIGLDTFAGEPLFIKDDARHNAYNVKGDYCSSFESVKAFLKEYKDKVKLIKGDFRKKGVQKKLVNLVRGERINVAVIDCNMLSSIRSCMELVFYYIRGGGFLFVDDFYTNMKQGRMLVRDILYESNTRFKKNLHHYKCYPPFAEAFIVVNT